MQTQVNFVAEKLHTRKVHISDLTFRASVIDYGLDAIKNIAAAKQAGRDFFIVVSDRETSSSFFITAQQLLCVEACPSKKLLPDGDFILTYWKNEFCQMRFYEFAMLTPTSFVGDGSIYNCIAMNVVQYWAEDNDDDDATDSDSDDEFRMTKLPTRPCEDADFMDSLENVLGFLGQHFDAPKSKLKFTTCVQRLMKMGTPTQLGYFNSVFANCVVPEGKEFTTELLAQGLMANFDSVRAIDYLVADDLAQFSVASDYTKFEKEMEVGLPDYRLDILSQFTVDKLHNYLKARNLRSYPATGVRDWGEPTDSNAVAKFLLYVLNK